jgi:hypothetical protein
VLTNDFDFFLFFWLPLPSFCSNVKLFLGFIGFVTFKFIFWGGGPYFLPKAVLGLENMIDFIKSGLDNGKLTFSY